MGANGSGGTHRGGSAPCSWAGRSVARGLEALRASWSPTSCSVERPALAVAARPPSTRSPPRRLAPDGRSARPRAGDVGAPRRPGAATTTPTWPPPRRRPRPSATRLIALVELARKGDTEAFGLLYDHYQGSVYRFLFYRTRSSTLAEDLTSETFFRALRSMNNFRWQGKDFGAWLMTIARNLATDHFKAGRTRLEMTTEDMGLHDDATEGPEAAVLPA